MADRNNLTTLAKRLRPLLGGYVQNLAGQLVGEGPGIDIVKTGNLNTVGLGGDSVLLYDSGGNPVAEFAATGAGLTAAIAAATSGDTILLPSVNIAGGPWTVAAGITLMGMSRHSSILTGNLTLDGGIFSSSTLYGSVVINNNGGMMFGRVICASGYGIELNYGSIFKTVVGMQSGCTYGLYIGPSGSSSNVHSAWIYDADANITATALYVNSSQCRIANSFFFGCKDGGEVNNVSIISNSTFVGVAGDGLIHNSGSGRMSNCFFSTGDYPTHVGLKLTAGGLSFTDCGWHSIDGEAFITYGTGDRSPANHTHAGSDPVTLAADAETLLSLTGQEISLDNQAANKIFSGPVSGAPADPTFRSLVAADLGTGAPDGTKYLRDDLTWQTAGGSGGGDDSSPLLLSGW